MESRSGHFTRYALGTALLLAVSILIAGCGNNSNGQQMDHTDNGMSMAKISTGNASSSPLHKWCSDCHAPPMPTSHKAQEWPSVVAQMQNHRITEGLARIDDQSLEEILEYLKSHAKP